MKEIETHKKAIDSFRCFFDEPYFARMDLTDPKEGYNSYYIGKKGDVKLEIVDWRAPLARKYYQKSRISFSINEYDYKTMCCAGPCAPRTGIGAGFQERVSVRHGTTSTAEEIGGRDEEILFDPYLQGDHQKPQGRARDQGYHRDDPGKTVRNHHLPRA